MKFLSKNKHSGVENNVFKNDWFKFKIVKFERQTGDIIYKNIKS